MINIKNDICHSTEEVSEYLFNTYKNVWWDYVTALRGDDFCKYGGIKDLFTCVIRGRNENSDAMTIEVTLIEIEMIRNKKYRKKIIKVISKNKYNHYRVHLDGAFSALSAYYEYLSAESNKNKTKSKIFKDCSNLMGSMSVDISNKDWDKYFDDLNEFILLVSEK
jgi:hypothetical protein